jgi:hypothetical protein
LKQFIVDWLTLTPPFPWMGVEYYVASKLSDKLTLALFPEVASFPGDPWLNNTPARIQARRVQADPERERKAAEMLARVMGARHWRQRRATDGGGFLRASALGSGRSIAFAACSWRLRVGVRVRLYHRPRMRVRPLTLPRVRSSRRSISSPNCEPGWPRPSPPGVPAMLVGSRAIGSRARSVRSRL